MSVAANKPKDFAFLLVAKSAVVSLHKDQKTLVPQDRAVSVIKGVFLEEGQYDPDKRQWQGILLVEHGSEENGARAGVVQLAKLGQSNSRINRRDRRLCNHTGDDRRLAQSQIRALHGVEEALPRKAGGRFL